MGLSVDEPVRILRVIARMNMGGPAHHVALLSGLLDRRGYETLLIFGQVGVGEASLEDVADAHGAQRRVVLATLRPELQPIADFKALLSLVRHVRRFRPQVVHTHTAKAGVLGRIAALAIRPRPKIVHTYHGHVLRGYFGWARTLLYRVLETLLGQISDRLVGVSEATVEDLVRLRVAPRRTFQVIPLGLDLGRFLAIGEQRDVSFRGEVGASEQDVLLLFVGRIVPIKRLDVMLRALRHARDLGAPVRLAIVGDGPTRPALELLSRELQICEAVSFVGYRRDLAQIVGSADIGVLSSDNEGTPVSLIEIAAGGRPLVATAVGGVADVLGAGCGLLAPPGDWRALGEAVTTLASDDEERRRMGGKAREHVRLRFSHERLIADVDALYRDLLEKREGNLRDVHPRAVSRSH